MIRSTDLPSYLIGDVKRRKDNVDAKLIFDNLVYTKAKVNL